MSEKPAITFEVRPLCNEKGAQNEQQVIAKLNRAQLTGVLTPECFVVDFVWVPTKERRAGVARELLKAVGAYTGKKVVPGCVLEEARAFWEQAKKLGLAEEPISYY